MAIKVAINGFGRIGRLAFRQLFNEEGYEITAINDLTQSDMLAYLLKYDTTQGRYKYADSIESSENFLIIDGKKIIIYNESDASKLPWKQLEIDIVLECTGSYLSKAKSQVGVWPRFVQKTIVEVKLYQYVASNIHINQLSKIALRTI